MNETKICTMAEAVTRYVADSDVVAIEGFTAFIDFAAAHEIIRQRRVFPGRPECPSASRSSGGKPNQVDRRFGALGGA